MGKSTESGRLLFLCGCGNMMQGTAEDTLIEEGQPGNVESNLKHATFLENSPFDPAANRVKKTCPGCGIDFMTLVRLGSEEVVIYTCGCGKKILPGAD
jgi:hypothetical protein